MSPFAWDSEIDQKSEMATKALKKYENPMIESATGIGLLC